MSWDIVGIDIAKFYETENKKFNKYYLDSLGEKMNDSKEMESFEKLKKILTSLTPKEKEALIKKFEGGNKTLEEVGRDYRVTRERIREIERKALRKLNRKHPEPPDEAA